jgi:hypothetical protein
MGSTCSRQWAYDFLEEFDRIEEIEVAHPLKAKAMASTPTPAIQVGRLRSGNTLNLIFR